MKKVVFLFTAVCSVFSAFSQTESTTNEKRLKYGFNLGGNYSNLIHRGTFPENASLSNDIGGRIGVLADYRMSKGFSISPKAELSNNNSKVNFSHSDGSTTSYKIMPISLEFMAHFVFKKNYTKASPYVYFGPNVKIPLRKKTDDAFSYYTNTDFAIDFGIGVNKTFTYFNFSPEFRYSFGLLNVNQSPAIQSLYFHNFSLIFNFIG